MHAVLALAFLALARAAYIEVPKTNIHDGLHIDPLWTTEMFSKYGLRKPMLDDISSWGKTIGVEDPLVLNHLRSAYDKPSLVFFQDPTGRVVSFYAHEGIDNQRSIPDIKSALFGLYGASDRVGINFHPESMLGNFKTVLPGHFFEPMNNIDLRSFMHGKTVTPEFVTFKPKVMLSDSWKKFDIDSLPMIFKDPVSLDITKGLSEGVVPMINDSPYTGFSDVSAAVPFGFERSAITPGVSHIVSGMPFTGFSDFASAGAVPFGFERSAIIPKASKLVYGTPFTGFSDVSTATPFGHGKSVFFPGASHLFSDMPFGSFRSGLGGFPAVKSAAYHLVKADMPYFTAAPAAGFVDTASAGFPLVKSVNHLFGAEPVHGTHFVHAPASIFGGVSPFAKAAVPCVNCLGAEHSFAPAGAIHAGAGVIPLVKTFGGFDTTDAFKSAFTGLSAEPMTFGATPAFVKAAPITSLFASPAVGLTGHPFGLTDSTMSWKKF